MEIRSITGRKLGDYNKGILNVKGIDLRQGSSVKLSLMNGKVVVGEVYKVSDFAIQLSNSAIFSYLDIADIQVI